MSGALVFVSYLMFLGGIILPHKMQTVLIELGMNKWQVGPIAFLCLMGLAFLSLPLLNKKKFLPSDFFIVFQFLALLTPMAALCSVSNYIGEENVLLALAVLVLPTFVLFAVRKINLKFPRYPLIGNQSVLCFFIVFLACVFFWTQRHSPPSAGFGLTDSYIRRLEGRELFVSRSLIAYLISMGTNLIAPFLGFLAGFKKNMFLFVLSFLVAVYFYWLLGIKATFLYSFASFGVGFLVSRKQIINLPRLVMMFVFFLSVVFLIEWRLNGYSYVADYFFRRVFSATVKTQGDYIDMIFHHPPEGWNFLFGLSKTKFSVTYFIGEHYDRNPLANSNTNAFLVAFGQGGLMGYLGAVIVIPFLFLLLDMIYQSNKNPVGLFIGFMFAVLILEQAYTTALLSSGIGFMILIFFFMKPDPVTLCRFEDAR
ncbi:MAG: hypothetical protein JNK54_06690 [Elusimicrobia bacterium]|nr:hypothetical protein [Elusimicrobiota bacterium]